MIPDLLLRVRTALAGRFTIERELGRGGMATVFLAADVKHGRHVAVKVLHSDLSASLGAERFQREIRLTARLQHPHILPLFDSGEADGLLYYVMPVVRGESLRDRLRVSRTLPLATALRLAREVALGLESAHRDGILHRDIKPENILLHNDSALVADFGIGKVMASAAETMTGTALVIGTPAYMSPEQAAGQVDLDARSDIYSLGCVLFEMLAGKPPFTGPTAHAVIAARFIGPPPSLAAAAAVPASLDALVTRMLAPAASDRLASAAELAEALARIDLPGAVTASAPAGRRRSMAVLPFANLSADPANDYLSDGLTEELLSALGRIPGLLVASRTSCFAFKGKELDIRQIGERLGVTTVLEGSVRRAGQRLRLSARLTDAESGWQLWTDSYDRELVDVFAMQEEIARAIVEALRPELAGEAATVVAQAVNVEAWEWCLKGRHFYNAGSEAALRRALECFEAAVALDPGYAPAHAGVADAYMALGANTYVDPHTAYPAARAAAYRALALTPALAEVHASLGWVALYYDWDFTAAEAQFRRAIDLNANYSVGFQNLARLLARLGRHEEAIATAERATAVDPLAVSAINVLAYAFRCARRFADAERQCRRALDLDAENPVVLYNLGWVLSYAGRHAEAVDTARRVARVCREDMFSLGLLGYVLAMAGQRDEAGAVVRRMEAQSARAYVCPFDIAVVHVALGAIDAAFQWFEAAVRERDHAVLTLGIDPGLDAIRADPRFAALLDRLRLPSIRSPVAS